MRLIEEWKNEYTNHKGLIFLSIIFLIFSIGVNLLAGNYVNKAGTAAVSDLILDHITPINLSFIFIWGYALVIVVLILHPMLFKVREAHSIIGQFSLLILIRSFFISLTHLKAPADAILVNLPLSMFRFIDFHNDLFFSAHTAIPFLGFLIFRKHKLGIFFLISTIVLAVTVLVMHVHYSIDVFAALFITYGSYKIGNWLYGRINHY